MGFFSSPDPPPPVELPDRSDEEVRAAALKERQRAANRFGRQSTILGGRSGGDSLLGNNNAS